MFVQLLKDFVGRKVGERIDVAEADATALIASGTAQAVSDDLISPAVQRAMERAFAGFQKGLDAVINTALKQFQHTQRQARKHAGPALRPRLAQARYSSQRNSARLARSNRTPK